MLRIASLASKAMWVGRTTAAVVGLAIALALVLGVATMALAAVPGEPFKLGQINTINALTQLVGNRNGPMLTIDNNSTNDAAHALNLQVDRDNPPIRVNVNSGTATGLSAARLDGLDSSQLARSRANVLGNEANVVNTVAYFRGFAFYDDGFRDVVTPPPEGPPIAVRIDCTNDSTPGTLRVVNRGEFGDLVDVWVETGSSNPTYTTLHSDDVIAKSVAPPGDHFTIRADAVFGGAESATMEIFTHHVGTGCEAVTHAIFTASP